MKVLFHVVGPDELFGADEALGVEVEAISCQPGIDGKLAKGTLQVESCDSLTEFPATQIDGDDNTDRPAA